MAICFPCAREKMKNKTAAPCTSCAMEGKLTTVDKIGIAARRLVGVNAAPVEEVPDTLHAGHRVSTKTRGNGAVGAGSRWRGGLGRP